MSRFSDFVTAFGNEEILDGDISELMEYVGSNDMPFDGVVVSDRVEDMSDSYDFTNDDLYRVIHFREFDVYVEFRGNYSSYQGEEWYGYKEVTPTSKTVTTYE